MVVAVGLAGCKKQTKATHDDDALAGEIQPLDDSADTAGADGSSYGATTASYGSGATSGGSYSSPSAAGGSVASTHAPAAVSAHSAPGYASGGSRTHIVQRGDTLWSIAKRTYGDGKRWQQIAAANPGVSPTRLRVGQTLALP